MNRSIFSSSFYRPLLLQSYRVLLASIRCALADPIGDNAVASVDHLDQLKLKLPSSSPFTDLLTLWQWLASPDSQVDRSLPSLRPLVDDLSTATDPETKELCSWLGTAAPTVTVSSLTLQQLCSVQRNPSELSSSSETEPLVKQNLEGILQRAAGGESCSASLKEILKQLEGLPTDSPLWSVFDNVVFL